MSCGVGCRHGLDLALLWLWCRPAAVALLQPLAWNWLCHMPYATHVALKAKKKKKKEEEEEGETIGLWRVGDITDSRQIPIYSISNLTSDPTSGPQPPAADSLLWSLKGSLTQGP